jgi:hypothetical protein
LERNFSLLLLLLESSFFLRLAALIAAVAVIEVLLLVSPLAFVLGEVWLFRRSLSAVDLPLPGVEGFVESNEELMVDSKDSLPGVEGLAESHDELIADSNDSIVGSSPSFPLGLSSLDFVLEAPGFFFIRCADCGHAGTALGSGSVCKGGPPLRCQA